MIRKFLVLFLMVIIAFAGMAIAADRTVVRECKIGAILPLAPTSPMPFTGEEVLRGLTIAAEHAPADFGVELDLMVEDDRGEGRNTLTKAEKFLSMKDVPVIITTFSHLTMPVCHLADRARKVHFYTISGTPRDKSSGDWSFRHFIDTGRSSDETAEFARKKLGANTAVCIILNVPTGHVAGARFKKKFKALGGKCLGTEVVEMNQKDFRSMLLAVKKKDPDVIYLWAHGSAFCLLLKQMKEVGIDSNIITMEAMNVPVFRKNAGSEAIEGVYFCLPSFDPDSENPIVARFVKAYRDKYGRTPDYFSAFAYDIGRLLAYAVSKGGNSTEAIREELLKIRDFPGALGKISIQPSGDVISGFTFMMIRDGNIVPAEK
ncbi:MAG: ABC transporter substrate-binding protein [Candidatus Eremiobacteraeota bacterium]|nr:ABC transporter substrate-binding protein [Candidatus Eremiobacteraeota bacterium]